MPVMASFARAARIAGHFDVAEPVEGEPRLPDLFALALEDVGVDGPGAAEVGRVDRAVGVEHFGEAEHDLRAGRPADLQPREAGEVLAHVEDVNARLRLGDLHRLQDAGLLHGNAGESLELGRNRIGDGHRLPMRRRSVRAMPSRQSPSGRRRFRRPGIRLRCTARKRSSTSRRWRWFGSCRRPVRFRVVPNSRGRLP